MEVPERLALIGGSILLASTLVFTLKSQASSIIPSVDHSVSHIFDHIGDAQKSSDFDNNFQQAQKNGQKTGKWGSADYYIDKDMNMHVGSGQLQDNLSNTVSYDVASNLNSVNFDASIQAPQDSSWLLAGSPHRNGDKLKAINGLGNMDTSHVTKMNSMFESNNSPTSLDISGWDTSHVDTMEGMFSANHSLRSLDLSHWDVSKLTDSAAMFNYNYSLKYLNMSTWNTKSDDNMESMLSSNDSLSKLSLGNQTKLNNNIGLPSVAWQHNSDSLNTTQLTDNQSHPGIWVRQ